MLMNPGRREEEGWEEGGEALKMKNVLLLETFLSVRGRQSRAQEIDFNPQ